jgi:hypothetical protein
MSDLHRRTHLFTVRLWVEQVAHDRAEVRGRVQHVLSGEVGYFRTWSDVVEFLLSKLHEQDGESRGEGGGIS